MAFRSMVRVITVSGLFHARVIAARLGAEGIVTELVGAVGDTYPLGGVIDIYVHVDQARQASEILLADAVDAVYADLPRDSFGLGTPFLEMEPDAAYFDPSQFEASIVGAQTMDMYQDGVDDTYLLETPAETWKKAPIRTVGPRRYATVLISLLLVAMILIATLTASMH